VEIYDPSFARNQFKMPEGKAKARLTYGTIKPEQAPYVNFEMIPKQAMKLRLEQVVLNYTPEQEVITEYYPDYNDLETIEIISRRAFLFSDKFIPEWIYSISGIIAVVIIPLLFGFSARRKRVILTDRAKKE
jgi:hypothetical protein